jgi:hypothetical protein
MDGILTGESLAIEPLVRYSKLWGRVVVVPFAAVRLTEVGVAPLSELANKYIVSKG